MISKRLSAKRLHKIDEWTIFFRQCFNQPMRMGAIAPSSKSLGKFMSKAIVYEDSDYVVELGAGTGRLTAEILNQGIPLSHLIAIELDPDLCVYLRNRYPGLLVIEGDACKLSSILPPGVSGRVCSVVSGMPLRILPNASREAIVRSSFDVMREKGNFIQFSYNPFSPIKPEQLGIVSQRRGTVLRNFPPATVWSFHKIPQAA